MTSPDKTDVYTKVTDRILADLEKGVRPWIKPWTANNAAGRILLPLRGEDTKRNLKHANGGPMISATQKPSCCDHASPCKSTLNKPAFCH